jgi:hypothetical protein
VTFSKLYISVIYKFLRQLYFAGFGSFAIFAPVKARWKVLYSKQSSFFLLSLVTPCTFPIDVPHGR